MSEHGGVGTFEENALCRNISAHGHCCLAPCKSVINYGPLTEPKFSVVARCGPLYYFLKERSNIFGHLGHLGHFEKCQACLHMTMEVTSNMEVILKVIFV